MRRASPLPPGMRRCSQCWQPKAEGEFLGARGGLVKMCAACRVKYRPWSKMTTSEKLSATPERRDRAPRGFVLFVERSGNTKTGPIPVSISERGTCPPSCGLYQAGCYAEYGKLGAHWRSVGAAITPKLHVGLSWDQFLDRIRKLSPGTLWRHNEAGDLAGTGEVLAYPMLEELVLANRGRRGFSFTHKHRGPDLLAIRRANDRGFTVNLSADSVTEADRLFEAYAGPVAVLLPHDAPTKLRTPAGHHVVVCPAQTAKLTCLECQLCAKSHRKAIVGFRAHGQFKRAVGELVQLRRKS